MGIDFCNALLLFAEEGSGETGFNPFGWFSILTLWLPLLVVFWLLMIRPQQRERARRQAMLADLKKNDHVIVLGAIHGVVTNVDRDANEVTVKVDEASNTKLRVTLGAIEPLPSDQSSDDSSSK